MYSLPGAATRRALHMIYIYFVHWRLSDTELKQACAMRHLIIFGLRTILTILTMQLGKLYKMS